MISIEVSWSIIIAQSRVVRELLPTNPREMKRLRVMPEGDPTPSVLFVASYSPEAVGGVGQFMIDLGTHLLGAGLGVGMCFRQEDREFPLPRRVSEARLFAVEIGASSVTRTPRFLLNATRRLLEVTPRFAVCHVIVPQPMSAIASVVAKIVRRPLILTVFAPYPKSGRYFADLIQAISERIVFRFVDAVAYECQATRLHFSHTKGVVVYNGIDTDFYGPDESDRTEIRKRMHIASDAVVVLYVGRIAESKGVGDLITAFSGLPRENLKEVRLLLVGPIEISEPGIRAKMDAPPVGVTFAGPAEKDAVRDYYRAADVFVLPSYREGISSSLIEAMACEIPAIVTDVGGNPEVVRDEEEGKIVPPRDVEALRGALTRLITDDKLRSILGRKARLRILSQFNMKMMAQQYIDLYQQLAASSKGSRRT